MSDQTDDSQNYALIVLAGVVALVIAGVVALAAYKGLGGAAKPTTAANAAVMTIVAGAPIDRIYFEPDSHALPPDTSQTLVRVADAARLQSGAVVLISGFRDASGNAAANAELAKKRAQAVRHALEANGVAPGQLVLDKPIIATAGGNAREARRVEIRLR